MKIAIPTWKGRVSPVMDTARELVIIEHQPDGVVARSTLRIPDLGAVQLGRFLRELGVDTLICGAISQPLERLLSAAGIRAHPWRCGQVDDIITAYEGGSLQSEEFMLPGRRRRIRGRGRGCRRRDRSRNKSNSQYKEKP